MDMILEDDNYEKENDEKQTVMRYNRCYHKISYRTIDS